MKLSVVSSQSKGLMGGVSFEVKGRVHLTPEEQELVKHYKLEGQPVLQKKIKNLLGQLTNEEVSVSVRNLLAGDSFKCKSLDEVLTYRQGLITACRNLKTYLEVARSFDEETTIDIDGLVAPDADDEGTA